MDGRDGALVCIREEEDGRDGALCCLEAKEDREAASIKAEIHEKRRHILTTDG